MNNAKTVFRELRSKITLPESDDEIRAVASLLAERVLGISRRDVMSERMVLVTPEMTTLLEKSVDRINRHEPVQYVLGEAHFYGRTFLVNPAVLIPRPETEELVNVVLSWRESRTSTEKRVSMRMLDIATGSGCLPVTLFLQFPAWNVIATDISAAALAVAKENAVMHNARVEFTQHDILKEDLPFENLDIVVSNPPYVPEAEKETLKQNVLAFEPHLALFVPDGDPLIFYKAIAKKAKDALNPGGLLAMEIHERFGDEVCEVFITAGFTNVELVRDIAGKPRVVRGTS